jgi:transposase
VTRGARGEVGRQKALFASSEGGNQHWAVIASLIETCKLIGVEPHAHLADVFTKIVNDHLNSRIDELLPWTYLNAPPLRRVA